MKRLFKILGWTVLSLILAIVLAVAIVLRYLTPEKLTPIVNREASALIDGKLETSRVELTFWSTFPRLEVDIDNLLVISHAMHHIPDSLRAELPAYTDSLLAVGKIHAGVDILSLSTGRIELYDLTIKELRANIVAGRDSINNYAIVKSGDQNDTTDDTAAETLPEIAFNRFTLLDAGPITYTSLPDTVFVSATLGNIKLNGEHQPVYKLELSADASSPLLDRLKLEPLTVGIDGRVVWNMSRPAAIKVNDLDIAINEFSATVDADIDATDTPVIESLAVKISNLNVNDIIAHLPDEVTNEFKRHDTDMAIDIDASLLKPYTLSDSLTIPSVDVTLIIPPCHFEMGNIHLNKIDFMANATIDGDSLDLSKLTVNRLILQGRALDVDVSGTVTGPVKNMFVDGHLATGLRINRLPRQLLNRLPVKMQGRLYANTGIRFHLNDLSPKGFHNIYLDGHVTLHDLDLMSRDSLLQANASRADLDFGTARTIKGAKARVDSMLTVALKIDTTNVSMPGLELHGSKLLAALGSLNRNSSSDTSRINPFGGVIRFKSLILDQPQDSLTIRLRDVDTKARLTRYDGNERAPELNFDLKARRIGTRMPDFALAISQPELAINAHLIPRQETTDTIRHRRHGSRRSAVTDSTQHQEVIDWNVSNDLKTLLKRWDVDGHLRSNRAFIFTRNFPLRQRASDIDLHFDTDTIRLNSLHYQIGNTRLDIKGDISNIERALTGRTGRSKLKIDVDIKAPYIDINQLATTTFYESSGEAGPDPDYDEEVSFVTKTDTTVRRPVLIPRNIDANLSVHADTILYADLLMHSFSGDVLINNCAINLHDFKASTEIGSASLSALYWAPDTTNMQFGMGMKLNRFYIDRVLSLIPAVDSLLPALQGFAGIINADLAATAAITPQMDFDLSSFKGALKLDGDSLVLLDADTFKMLAKWLIFKNKKRNMIDHMSVEIVVDNSQIEIFPFIFDIDRYRLGVMGRNDLEMNLDYHVSVLKSPLPFKFGINIKGNLDNPKFRLGGAKVKPGSTNTYTIADTTRISLLGQIEEVFRRGSMSREAMGLRNAPRLDTDAVRDTTLSANDSILMKQEGLLPSDSITPAAVPQPKKRRSIWKKQ